MTASTNTNTASQDPREAAVTVGNTSAAAADQNLGHAGVTLPVWPRSDVNAPTGKGADAVATSTNTNAGCQDPPDAAVTVGNTNAAAADHNPGHTGVMLPVWPRIDVDTTTNKGADTVTTSTNTNTDGQDPRDAAVTVDNTTAAVTDPNTAHAGEVLAVLQIRHKQGRLLGDLHAHSLEDDDGHTLPDVIAHQNTLTCRIKQWDKAGGTYKCEQCPARMSSNVKPPWPTSPLKHGQGSVIPTDRPGLIWPAASPPLTMSVNPPALAPAPLLATAGLPTCITLGHTGASTPTLRAQPQADGKLPVRNPPPGPDEYTAYGHGGRIPRNNSRRRPLSTGPAERPGRRQHPSS